MIASEELKRAEFQAMALSRGLSHDPIGWGELLAMAQQEIGRHQQRLTLGDPYDLYDEQNASGLIAAARIVLEVSKRPSSEHGKFEEVDAAESTDSAGRRQLTILASCAFSMYGNFPSAVAVQRNLQLNALRSEGQWLAVAVSNPQQIAHALYSDQLTAEGREFLERLNHFLVSGDERIGDTLVEHFEKLMRTTREPSEVIFLRCARLALKHIIVLAVSNLYKREFNNIFKGFVEKVINTGRLCLLPPQYTLITKKDLLGDDKNSIITIPTSTGKTLIGELAIAARLGGVDDIAVYVTPYIALGRQVFDSFKEHAPPDVDVRGYFGNFNSWIEPLSGSKPTIIVATPERLDAILRTHDVYARLRTIIFDEAHGIENGVRGARLESLITRLRLQQQKFHNMRIILLSAVLKDVDVITEWLGGDAVHYHDTWRPTARRLGIWRQSGNLTWLYGADPLRPSGVGAGHIIGLKKLPWPDQMVPASSFQGVAAQRPSAYRNVAFLARYLQSTIGGPVLVACATRASTRGLATMIASEIEEIDKPCSHRDALVKVISEGYPHLAGLSKMVAKGVAYHNASLPGQVRVLIEEAIKTRALNFVAATTTLAEGVDLPFRITIIFDWLIGFKEQQAPMSALLFRNISGRCGRAGEFTEGDTIIFDNVLGDTNFTAPERRGAAQATLFSDPPTLRSVIANDNLPSEMKAAVRSIVSSQLLASIPENPEIDALEEMWASATYAAFQSVSPLSLMRDLRLELLNDANGEPFARAASPMRLTPLGIAANKSGFGPRTCRQILQYLSEIDMAASTEEVVANLLNEFGACDEQGNYLLRDVTKKKRSTFYVKSSDITAIAKGWLENYQLIDIFLSLPKAIASKAAIKPAEWARGDEDYEPIASQYDKFVDLTEYTFGSFLPWLLRAIAALSAFGPSKAADYDWYALAVLFEDSRTADMANIDNLAVSGPQD